FDPHKPFVDELVFACPECDTAGGGKAEAKPGNAKRANRDAGSDPGSAARDAQSSAPMMRRVPEVIDTWFDSGSMPFAQWHYPFDNRDVVERLYPADFICEGVDQTRGWFYSLLAIATGLGDALPHNG